MSDQKYLRRHQDELSGTNAAITPICILVDRSWSMKSPQFVDESGLTRMNRLNQGIQQFIEQIKEDDMLADSVEISIVGFADDMDDDPQNPPVEELLKFSTIENIGDIEITATNRSGDTPLGVTEALRILEDEKQFLKDNKSKYNQPWLVIFSDGHATPSAKWKKENGHKDYTDINRRLKEVQQRTRTMEDNKKLTVIPVLISESNDKMFERGYRQMKDFSAKRRALVLCKDPKYNPEGLTFKDFFKILGKSVSVSNADLMFSSGGKVYNQDRQTTEYNIDSYLKKDQVASYLRSSSEAPKEAVINKANLLVYLPYALASNETIKIAYNPRGAYSGDWNEYFLDGGEEIKQSGNTLSLSMNLNDGVDFVQLYIGVFTAGSHEYKETLANGGYAIKNGSVIINLSTASRQYQDNIEKLKAEAAQSTIVPAQDEPQEDVFNQEEARPLPTVKTKVDTSTADDDYLNNLLSGLDDWDNI